MVIRLARSADPRVNILVITRDDGTVTQSRSALPIQHDLIHYAVERTLGFRNAFYGMIARGYDIADFAQPGATKKLDMAAEAGWTELIVSLLQVEQLDGRAFDDFNEQLQQICETRNIEPPPPLSDKDLETIRCEIKLLTARWESSGDSHLDLEADWLRSRW